MTPTMFLPLAMLLCMVSSQVVSPGPGPQAVPASTPWSSAYFRGTPNNFGFTAMTRSQGEWTTTQTFGSSSAERFRITRLRDWTDAYPPSDYFITQGPGDYLIKFNDVTKVVTAVKISGNINIQIQCDKGTTTPGISVYAIGSSPEFGKWRRANAVRLSPTAYPSWTGVIPVKIGSAVEWKCLKRSESDPNKGYEYEPGVNNKFTAIVPIKVTGSF